MVDRRTSLDPRTCHRPERATPVKPSQGLVDPRSPSADRSRARPLRRSVVDRAREVVPQPRQKSRAGLCPAMGRLRRRRPHLGKRGRFRRSGLRQLLGPEEGKWLSLPSFSTPTPHPGRGGGVGWVGFPKGRAGSKHTTPRPIGLRGEHPLVPRPISVLRDSTEMWCGPGIMLEEGIPVSVLFCLY